MMDSNMDWDTSPSILEWRISIHPSLTSEAFTTVKKTTVLADGKRITAVALTDAVKGKTGFSGIFVRRSEDLSGDRYAPLGKLKVGDRLVSEHTIPDAYNNGSAGAAVDTAWSENVIDGHRCRLQERRDHALDRLRRRLAGWKVKHWCCDSGVTLLQ